MWHIDLSMKPTASIISLMIPPRKSFRMHNVPVSFRHCKRRNAHQRGLLPADNRSSFLTIYIFAIFRRRHSFGFFENTAKIKRIIITNNTGNFSNIIAGILKQYLCIVDSLGKNILHRCKPVHTLKLRMNQLVLT